MMPLGPQFIRLLNINTHQFGLLLSSYTFAAAISGLLATFYIDRFERRKLLLTFYALFVIATLACGLAPNYEILFVARALAGCFGGIMGSMVQTIVADAIPFERRGKALGTVMAAFSVSTVAGVPLSLFLANHIAALNWRAPFIFIAIVSTVILWLGYEYIPVISGHLEGDKRGSRVKHIYRVFIEPQNIKAYIFVALIMISGFSVIPYIALYLTANVGIVDSYISLIYLCGGLATLFSSRFIGHGADRYGKARVFRILAIIGLIPILTTTNMVSIPLWLVLVNSTVFFVLISGRMIPAMAMVSQVVDSKIRGTFMSLIGSTQMLAAGIASVVAGMVISKTPTGQILHYEIVGYGAAICGLLTCWMAGYIHSKDMVATPQHHLEIIE